MSLEIDSKENNEVENNTEIELNEEQQRALDNYERMNSSTERSTEKSEEEISEEGSTDNSEELIRGKFKNQEDLLSAYKELEKKLGSGEDNVDNTNNRNNTNDNDDSNNTNDNDDNNNNEKDNNGLEKFSTEFFEKGELSNESYEELKNLGISKDIVDQYIEGYKLTETKQVEEFTNKVTEDIGGVNEYNKMTQWASENLAKEQIDSFNNSISNATAEQAKFIVQGLYSQYSSNNNTQTKNEPNLLQGNTNIQTNKGYSNRKDMARRTQDPRYGNDMNYTRQIQNKILATDNEVIQGI